MRFKSWIKDGAGMVITSDDLYVINSMNPRVRMLLAENVSMAKSKAVRIIRRMMINA
jgi:hypothetical protein